MKNKKLTKAQEQWDKDVPPHLSTKILRGIQFLSRSKNMQDAKSRTDFLKTDMEYSAQEIAYITLMLCIPIVDKFFDSRKNLDLAKEFIKDIPTPATIH